MIRSLTETIYTDEEIEKMRAQLAKTWRQSKSQVTDCEARFYLDLEREFIQMTSQP
jgi:sulfur transfer protein SufE